MGDQSLVEATEPSRESIGVANAVTHLERLESGYKQRIAEAKEGIRSAAAKVTSREDIAWIYWNVPQVSCEILGDAARVYEPNVNPATAVRRIANSIPGWVSICPGCGVEVPVTSRSALQALRSSARKAYLNPECEDCRRRREEQSTARTAQAQERARQLRTMPYRDYLQTPEWKETRERKLKAVQFRCQVCNGKGVLNVHHRTYERRGEERWGDLIVLCQDCHHGFHEFGKLES